MKRKKTNEEERAKEAKKKRDISKEKERLRKREIEVKKDGYIVVYIEWLTKSSVKNSIMQISRPNTIDIIQ